MKEHQLLMKIIGQTVLGTEDGLPLAAFDAAALYGLAKKHDLAHLLAPFFEAHRDTVDKTILARADAARRAALLREAKRDYTQEIVCDTLQKANIAFVPLKGARIKTLYPKAWMRTSCDIDVLVGEADFENAVGALTAAGFTTDGKKHFHDLSLFLDDVHLELHFNILEELERIDGLLARVWEYTEREDGVMYRETDAFFVFHHVAHMAYHIMTGGCGIKPFVDLYLLRQKGMCDDAELPRLLAEAALTTFYDAVCALCAVWFDGAEHTGITEAMEEYVLDGGVYGSHENHHAVQTGARKSRGQYLAARAFPSVKKMKMLYPVLTRSRASVLLLPFCYAARAVSKLFGKDRKDVRHTAKSILTQTDETIDSVSKLIAAVGLG